MAVKANIFGASTSVRPYAANGWMPSSDSIRLITLGGGADPAVSIFIGESDRADTWKDDARPTVAQWL